jgi:hypothetical protein
MAVVVFITSEPVDAFVKGRWEPGFKFLSVPYESKFENYYLPASLDPADYPNLIKQGERVTTIACRPCWWPSTGRSNRTAMSVSPASSNICSRVSTSYRDRASTRMEIDQSRGHGSGSCALPGGADVARSPPAPNAGVAMRRAVAPNRQDDGFRRRGDACRIADLTAWSTRSTGWWPCRARLSPSRHLAG